MKAAKESKKHATHAFSGYQLTHKLLNNLQQFNISPTAKLVLLYLASCYNAKKADVFPKQKTIATKLGVSERSVVRAVSELVKAGLILIEYKYSNRYKFTALIAADNVTDEKNFATENMSDDLRKNDDKKPDNLSHHDIKPTTKPINQPLSVEDYKILKDYAQKHGAKNVNAYINALKKKGSYQAILDSYKAAKQSSEYMQGLTQKFLDDYKYSKDTAVPPTKAFLDMKQILLERCAK